MRYIIHIAYPTHETLISKRIATYYIPLLVLSATQKSCKGSASPARTIAILYATSTASANARKDFMTAATVLLRFD